MIQEIFVRLQEKGQDNISKPVAVEKEPLTLEKDNEGQSKYYLSYSKPSVLDMKWENHDINVIVWANIPKFPPLLTEWTLGGKVILRPMECLTPTVKFDVFTTISHLFDCRPTIELTTFERQVCSATQMHCHWKQTTAKKRNVATSDNAHQAKKQCNFESS